MRLLIIGNLDGHMATAGKIAMSSGAKISSVATIEAALSAVRAGQGADLALCDIDQNIAQLIRCLKAERINLPVVACGLGNDAEAAVCAIKAGAREYVPLPPDAEMIAAVLTAVADERYAVIYRDPIMGEVLQLAEQIAPSDASVLITGESGTGKEVIARYLHRKSRRSGRTFISVNCAAIPENLLESELFGHEKGAFTGAISRRIGKFEEASGGTLLLDEISEMHPRLQAKLLRAVQEREIDRVGGKTPVKVNIRLLATSNRDLEEQVRIGEFREDLYFRLNVVTLNIPPLRERRGDIDVLSQYFIKKYSESNQIPERPLTAQARSALYDHHWRGNVRELENTLHRAVLLAKGDVIDSSAIMLSGNRLVPLGASVTPPPGAERDSVTSKAAGIVYKADEAGGGGQLVGRTVAQVERDLIINTLHHCLGNRTHAANILGISIRTLRNKLKLYSGDGVGITT